MLTADQLHAAARDWYRRVNGLRDEPSDELEHAGDGPYHLVVAVHEIPGTMRVRQARQALVPFTAAAIPSLCPLTGRVLTGEVSLHVLPQLVYDEVAWRVLVDASLSSGPYAVPPTEADLAETFLRALTVPGQRHGRHGRVLQGACERLGWATVANLINAMDDRTRKSAQDVVAVLGALTSQPAPAG